jgi:chemotaxis protein MotB
MSAARERDHYPPPRSGGSFKAWFLALLGIGGCGALGYYYWELRTQHLAQRDEMLAVQDAADQCETKLTPALARSQECEGSLAEEGKRLDELGLAQKKMEADLQATSGELVSLRELKVHAEQRAAAFEELKAQLKEMIDSGQLDVQRREGRLIVQLPAEVLFASGSADLSEDGKVALIKLSAVLEKMPDRKFMVAGHTDALAPMKGSKFRNNWELSTARAVNVTELLVTAKINPKNLVAAGYGEFAPISGNDNEAGRKKNRRIELVLLPNIEELTAFDDGATPADAAKKTRMP